MWWASRARIYFVTLTSLLPGHPLPLSKAPCSLWLHVIMIAIYIRSFLAAHQVATPHVMTANCHPPALAALAFAVSGVLRVIMIAISDVVGKPPTESVFFEKYSRIACVIDEVLNEVRC
jgi:hypothetical protein